MKFKLDENLGGRCHQLFIQAGHEVQTVLGEGISGCSDTNLYKICRYEHRCLVTLDKDFTDVIRFPPEKTEGIIVIRFPKNPSIEALQGLVKNIIQNMGSLPLNKRLWIVEPNRIRIHQSQDFENYDE